MSIVFPFARAAVVVSALLAASGADAKPVGVSLTNDLAVMTFDGIGRVSSIRERETGRELAETGVFAFFNTPGPCLYPSGFASLGEGDTEMYVEEPPERYHDTIHGYGSNGNAFLYEGELIQYSGIRREKPWGYTGVTRAAKTSSDWQRPPPPPASASLSSSTVDYSGKAARSQRRLLAK